MTPTNPRTPGGFDEHFVAPPYRSPTDAYDQGIAYAANIAASLGYAAVARAILAGGDPEKLEALFDERARTLVAPTVGMRGALASLVAERARQERLFPGEALPDGTGTEIALILREVCGFHVDNLLAQVRHVCDVGNQSGTATFALVALEECLEALVETDAVKLRAEVSELGAVACKWIESLDARASK